MFKTNKEKFEFVRKCYLFFEELLILDLINNNEFDMLTNRCFDKFGDPISLYKKTLDKRE